MAQNDSTLKANLSRYAWKGRSIRLGLAAVGFFMGLNGMTAETTWLQLFGMMGPMTIGGLILVLGASGSTSGGSA